MFDFLKRRPKTPEDHEAMLLERYADELWRTEQGIMTRWGYYISDGLWQKRITERRWPYRDHDFRFTTPGGELVTWEGGVCVLRPVTCVRCGDHREKVGVSLREVNLTGWCI